MFTKAISLMLFCIACNVRCSSGQCFTDNDIQINETSIGTAVRTLIDGNLRFSINLLRTLESRNRGDVDLPGLFFSPYSVWSALMLTYLGAKGRTEAELQQVLGIGSANKDTVWGAYRNIRNWNSFKQIHPQDESYHLANKVYFQEGTPIRDCIKAMIDTDIGFADFIGNPEGSTNDINKWVMDHTHNKIQNLIPQGGIGPMTKMVIANAVYFKELWEIQFDTHKTKRGRFTLPSRNDIYVPMMNTKGRFLYGISETLQCTGLELPYKGNDLSMLILLPNNRYYGVSILANRLTPEHLQDFLADMYPREVLVSVPRFKTDNRFELAPSLEKIGLRTLFDPLQADLSDFTGENDLSVDAVHHQSFIDINEEGTEAAAATAIISSRIARPLGPAAFIADYPFIFLIRDNLANLVLFMGTVQKPPEFERD